MKGSNQQGVEALPKEGLAPTKVGLKPLLTWLDSYPCRAEAEYLASGFQEGFCIPYEGLRVQEPEIHSEVGVGS